MPAPYFAVQAKFWSGEEGGEQDEQGRNYSFYLDAPFGNALGKSEQPDKKEWPRGHSNSQGGVRPYVEAGAPVFRFSPKRREKAGDGTQSNHRGVRASERLNGEASFWVPYQRC